MKVSTKGRYGVRALIDLAMQEDGASIKEIAGRQNLSHRYLERLFASLRQAGIVESVRGSQGGYQLARPADQIRMSEVVGTLEGSIMSVDCVGNPDICPITCDCVPHGLWARVDGAVNEVLSSTLLADLVHQEKEIRIARSK